MKTETINFAFYDGLRRKPTRRLHVKTDENVVRIVDQFLVYASNGAEMVMGQSSITLPRQIVPQLIQILRKGIGEDYDRSGRS